MCAFVNAIYLVLITSNNNNFFLRFGFSIFGVSNFRGNFCSRDFHNAIFKKKKTCEISCQEGIFICSNFLRKPMACFLYLSVFFTVEDILVHSYSERVLSVRYSFRQAKESMVSGR